MHRRGDTEIDNYLKIINPKVNTLVWPDFELAYYDVAAEHVNHYPTGLLKLMFSKK